MAKISYIPAAANLAQTKTVGMGKLKKDLGMITRAGSSMRRTDPQAVSRGRRGLAQAKGNLRKILNFAESSTKPTGKVSIKRNSPPEIRDEMLESDAELPASFDQDGPQMNDPRDMGFSKKAKSYGDQVDLLSSHMPYLCNVRGTEIRHPHRGEIYCYDTPPTGVHYPSLTYQVSLPEHAPYPSALYSTFLLLQPGIKEKFNRRHILVEDLSPLAIEHLGNTFGLNPEFFEEHLNQSGFRASSYDDPSPRTWITSAEPKDYCSVRWFRPVYRKNIKPLSEIDRKILLSATDEAGGLKWRSLDIRGAVNKTMLLMTNIFRSEWALGPDPEQALIEDEDSRFPGAWEERITIHVRVDHSKSVLYIILLDPKPELRITSQFHSTNSQASTTFTEVPFVQAYSRAPTDTRYGLRNIFRGNWFEEQSIQKLGAKLASTNSTREDLTLWWENSQPNPYGLTESRNSDIITGLLWIIHRDVIGFLYLVNNVLNEIGAQSADDYLLQKRLTHWRQHIARFQKELPIMRGSIKDFFQFLEQFQELGQAKTFVQHTLDEIQSLIDQNERSYNALRQDMALLESKRGIDQAESVGKLTELGFVFLPISCIAGIFSMQVEPFTEPVPLYAFFVTTMITIGLVFIVRLSIRSSAWMEYKRELSREIRQYMGLSPGVPIPTRTFVFYMTGDLALRKLLLRRIWEYGLVILLILSTVAVLLLPIIFLWTRNKRLDIGYKGTLTIIILVFEVGVFVPFVFRSWLNWNFPKYDPQTEESFLGLGLLARMERSSTINESRSWQGSSNLNRRKTQAIWQRSLVAIANWLFRRENRRGNDSESLSYTAEHISAYDNSRSQAPEGTIFSSDRRGSHRQQALPTSIGGEEDDNSNSDNQTQARIGDEENHIIRWRDNIEDDFGSDRSSPHSSGKQAASVQSINSKDEVYNEPCSAAQQPTVHIPQDRLNSLAGSSPLRLDSKDGELDLSSTLVPGGTTRTEQSNDNPSKQGERSAGGRASSSNMVSFNDNGDCSIRDGSGDCSSADVLKLDKGKERAMETG
ncbi:hypothetical protein BS50DRAFT_678956 [Corynespora cassiicola Philippines]|uniref:Cora-domain-containing protein n=1 Tax=Corynespora cassiicola Philippines TaxID=1448308 RepID=A0A2T2NE62_CORCC|nr:hypothetical protein BS50DRAFT_678956 [Corynespora cassiicola Philippines]